MKKIKEGSNNWVGSYKVERDWSIAKLQVIKEMKCLGLNKCFFVWLVCFD